MMLSSSPGVNLISCGDPIKVRVFSHPGTVAPLNIPLVMLCGTLT